MLVRGGGFQVTELARRERREGEGAAWAEAQVTLRAVARTAVAECRARACRAQGGRQG